MPPGPFPEDCAARYSPVAPLASGGFGQVWRGVQIALDRPVAIKLLHASADPELAARFDREARVTATLAHPAIVTVLDHGNARGVPWIAFELLPGPALRDRIEKGALALDEALAVTAQVASALAAGHAAGILHRDVKPENVIGAGPGRYKVVDFGIAAFAGGENSIQTATGVLLGTPAYVSPEQVEGKDAQPASDVYALGCMLYELVAGRPPFEGSGVGSLLIAHVKTPSPRLEKARPGTPAPVSDLVARMMAKEPAARPSAGEVAAELESLRAEGAGRRVGATRRTGTTGVVKTVVAPLPSGRRIAPVALAALAALAAVGLAAFRPRPAPAPSPLPTPTPAASASVAALPPELKAVLVEAEDVSTKVGVLRNLPRFEAVPGKLIWHGSSGDGLLVANAPDAADLEALKTDCADLLRAHDPLAEALKTLGDRAEALAAEPLTLPARAALASLHARAFVEWSFGQLVRARLDRVTGRRHLTGSVAETVGNGLPYENLDAGKPLLKRLLVRLAQFLAECPRTWERVPNWAMSAISRSRWAFGGLASAVRQNPQNGALVDAVQEPLIRLEREVVSGRELSVLLHELLVLDLGNLERFRRTHATPVPPDQNARLASLRAKLEAMRGRFEGPDDVVRDLAASLKPR